MRHQLSQRADGLRQAGSRPRPGHGELSGARGRDGDGELHGGDEPDPGTSGNRAANLTNQAVTNNTLAIPVIVSVAIVSTPTFDADDDGAPETYFSGEKIEVEVTFSEAVTAGGANGTAWVRLDVGDDDGNLANSQKLTFVAPGSASGSGTATLRFEYTVAAADTDADGVWVQTTSATDLTVVIASGEFSVKSVAHPTVDAELTKSGLPTSGDPNHKVHGNWPRVTGWLGVSSPETGDTYGVGEQFLIRAAFNTNVTVTGAPQLEIAVGTNARQVEYSTGCGTNMPTFAYTVVPGDLDADGISIAANSLTLNGGTITDTDGRAVLLSHAAIPDNPGHKVYGGPLDLTGPALDSVTVDGVTLVLTYDEPLRGPAPAARAFTVRVDRRSRTVDSVELAGNALTLTLASAVDDDSTVTASYRASRAGGNPVQDP